MAKDYERLKKIYDKTNGYCHLCHRKLCFENHGIVGSKGAWHIEHSVPKCRGGSNHLNNLFPACVSCNLEKGKLSNRSIRNQYGVARAPYCKVKKQRIREENTLAGIFGGGVIGAIFGPPGILIGGIIGGIVGESSSPKT